MKDAATASDARTSRTSVSAVHPQVRRRRRAKSQSRRSLESEPSVGCSVSWFAAQRPKEDPHTRETVRDLTLQEATESTRDQENRKTNEEIEEKSIRILHAQDKAREKDAKTGEGGSRQERKRERARAQPVQAASVQCEASVRSQKQTDRKTEFEWSVRRIEDERSSARTASEVKSQETLCLTMFGLERMETKFHKKLNETVCVRSWHELRTTKTFSRDFALKSAMQSLSDDQTLLEDRVRNAACSQNWTV